MPQLRRADATWSGDLLKGRGNVSATTSGAFRNLPVTWASRIESADGRTSPEELIAAAHAACFSMAFANGLAKDGHPAERLSVSAQITFDKVAAGWRITRSDLTVRGKVAGMSAADFKAAAEAAKVGCPISNALSKDIELTVDAKLEG